MLSRGYYDQATICIDNNILPDQSDDDCDLLTDWQHTQHSQIRDYRWSLDGQKIIFNYVSEDQQSGGLCIVDTEALSIDCPIQKQVTDGIFNGAYRERPENNYGFFTYNNGSPLEDFGDYDSLYETGLCLVNQYDYSVDCVTDHELPVDAYFSGVSLSPSHDLLALLYTGQHFMPPSGACIIDLQQGTTVCPDTSSVSLIMDTFGWSPDSRFFLTIFSYGPGSDDKSTANAGIFDVQAGTYRDEGYVVYENTISNLWRPLLEP
jgi:hypothetical protein